MDAVSEITDSLPMEDIAARLGVDREQAQTAVAAALPTLLAGMGANAADPRGLASLQTAVGEHDPALLDGGVNLATVDEQDGDKIVDNVFGAQRGEVVQRLGGAGADSGLVARLLPILAPIVLSYLAKRITGRTLPGGAAGGGSGSGSILSDVLGQVLGGGRGGGGLGGVLGSVLGGARSGPGGSQPSAPRGGGQAGSGSPLDELLGGVLGGGKRA